MRTFEILFVLVNVLTLCLSLRKWSKGVWLGAVGVNVAILILHGFFEGFRYQMVFSYLFTMLFTIYTLIKASGNFFVAKLPTALKIIIISFSLVCLILTSFLASALPVFTLPQPTGNSAVGIKYFHLVDEKRNEPFLKNSTKKRELMVKVYYPAKPDKSKPFSPYFHNSPELIRLLTAGNRLPSFLLDQLNLVKTNSKEGLHISDTQSSYPVILFSHGAGTSMEVHTSQCEDLASHGYIVVAIDHTYISAATVFPDKIVTAQDATTVFAEGDPRGTIAQIAVDDDKFVMDKLAELNEGGIDPQFKGRLNLDEIGAIGHSFGGAVAYDLAINDSRVKAAIDLDGTVYTTPKGGTNTMAPFLMLANDKIHIQRIQNHDTGMQKFADMSDKEQKDMLSVYGSKEAYDKDYNETLQNLVGLANTVKASGNLYTIEGSDHMKFTDIGLFFGNDQLRQFIGIGGKTEPVRCLVITEALTLTFFEQHLKHGEATDSLLKQYPELKKVALT
ncbi:alpha/beta hydrolase family protein [Ktedonospora formicarum]|uniref:Carboxylic ester hydrolase n=1 Tax=Ktedonospora formicarum TaxID=2778364 RepID=A0A8J3MSI0_9CHLR|nr:dienelactone hydrolase family protein [Ktedonospora formicarum]GHO47082.1 carboxylic ester hydrolase [Ktedonospora formicarum]